MLSDQDFLRYQRQIALPEITEQGQANLSAAHVLIVGCLIVLIILMLMYSQ